MNLFWKVPLIGLGLVLLAVGALGAMWLIILFTQRRWDSVEADLRF
jgi:hypothetical protein